MTDLDRKDLEEQLWKTIDHERVGMLGYMGDPKRHLQPMTGFAEPQTRTIWFFCQRDNDLIQNPGRDCMAMFCINAKDHDLWACLGGELSESHDSDRIDRFWGPVTAAWFRDGKDDPKLTLLRFSVNDAQVWSVKKGPFRFAYEIAKANLTKDEPDVGGTVHLRFN